MKGSLENVIQDWEAAHREAFMRDVLDTLANRPTDLLPFEEVRQRFRLRTARYLGLQDVPLDKIIGSVDRYTDFNRAFLPRQRFLARRWQNIDRLVTAGVGLEPVELYKVGDVYFVHDGNHRVSVARYHGAPTIQAYVWEYDVRVPLTADMDVNDLLCQAARAEFLERTNADRLCPEIHIELSQPDGYELLYYEIQSFQQTISAIDQREVPQDEAVALWCEMYYAPVVEIIRQRRILEHFPGRTEADLYIWLRRNQEELELRYGQRVPMERAAEELARRFGRRPSWLRRINERVSRLIGGVGELSGRLAENIRPASEDRVLLKQEVEAVTNAMMASICQVARGTPRYRFVGNEISEFRAWQASFRDRLWDLLGVGERPWRPYTAEDLDAEILETQMLDGIRRELLLIRTEGTLRVPVYLFVPPAAQSEGSPRSPAIAVFPGHGTIEQTAGIKKSYQRGNALELARAGFVTATMELRGFGWLQTVGHLRIDAAAKLVGRTWYGLLVHDAMRLIDYLLIRPEVDPTRIGATGIGAGGALAMYTAALDERVQVALVNSYLGKYSTTCLDQEHCPCNDIPGIRRDAEMGDVAALIAPRPVLFVNGQRDPASNPGARESFAVLHRAYQVLGVPNRAKLIEPEHLGHTYDNQLAIGWFRRWLMRQPDWRSAYVRSQLTAQ